MTDHRFYLAHFNVARIKSSLDDPVMAGLVESLVGMNALAESSPGFVWRSPDVDRDETTVQLDAEDRIVINFSVWEDLASLYDFVYRSAQAGVAARWREWFGRLTDMSIALWWVPAGYQPSIDEALARLEHLRRHGPSPAAFMFTRTYSPPRETADVPERVAS
jgi:hypothetical protein